MKRREWRQLLLWSLVSTLLAAGLSLSRPGWLARFEYGIYDAMLRSIAMRSPSGQIVIVDIDERSLAAVGQWPWRRDVMAQLVRRLRDLGASVIALDIIFAEADRYQTTGAAFDDVLADTLRTGRVVLGYALTFDRRDVPSTECVHHSLGLPIVRRFGASADSDTPFFRATQAICNLPALTAAASGSGFLNAAPDPDGILRRAPLLMELNGRVYPSLALAAVSAATGARDPALHVVNVNTSRLVLGTGTVPLDGKANLLLRYRGPKRTFKYVSAVDVLKGTVDSRMITSKIVLVGTTALGTREVVATPLDTLFAGVEVQATVADNLLQQDFVYRHEHGAALETQTVLASGIFSALAVSWLGLGWGGALVGALLGAIWIGAISAMSAGGTFFSPLFPTIGLTTALAAMTVARYAIERRHAVRADHEKATSQRLMVRTLLSLTETRDADTGRHSRRTENYARALATELAASPRHRDYFMPERIDLFASLAPIHDIGKVGIPDRLLNKPGRLTAEELVEMRRHPVYGRDVIVRAQRDAGAIDDEILTMAKDIVYTHHERWDGTGYPQGLRGTAIPIVGRVMAVVDVYDAMMTRRPYQAPLTHEAALKIVGEGRGTHFDPDVVDAFMRISTDLARLSADGDR
jgi:HD-GYP domain-containing protein (c-di-GMP phosphodiesterase class II)